MTRFLSHFEAGALGDWLKARAKGIYRRQIQRHKAKRNPPRPITAQERKAALRPEIKS